MNDKDGDETTTNKVKLIGSKFSPLKRKYFYCGNRHNINRIFDKKTISDIANGTNHRLPSHFKNMPWITINLNYLNQNYLKLLKHSR